MLVRMLGEGNTYLFLVGVQTGTVTVEISVDVSQEAENQSASRSSYTTLGHIPKGLYVLQQTYLLIQVHCCSIYHSQKFERM